MEKWTRNTDENYYLALSIYVWIGVIMFNVIGISRKVIESKRKECIWYLVRMCAWQALL